MKLQFKRIRNEEQEEIIKHYPLSENQKQQNSEQLLSNTTRYFQKFKQWKSRDILLLIFFFIVATIFFIYSQSSNSTAKLLQVDPNELKDEANRQKIKGKTGNSQKQLRNEIKSKSERNNQNILRISKSSEQLMQIIKSMSHPKDRPQIIHNAKKSIARQDDVYFFYALSREPENQNYLMAEFYYYDKKYEISQQFNQISLCVVIVGRNLGKNATLMLSSVINQNYTNYQVVFIDDKSDDNTPQRLKDYIQNNSLGEKVTLIEQQERRYALFNRNLAIRKYCKEGDIVVDLDADDSLIGRQVFKIINKNYQSENVWACYFNNIIYSPSCRCPLLNGDTGSPVQILRKNQYRTSNIWRTTQLRSFRKSLYDKIDEKDFLDIEGRFYKWKSDAFINFGLVELAGHEHTRFVDEFPYLYNTRYPSPSAEKSYCRISAKLLPPYLPLRALNDTPERISDYRPPQKLVNQIKALSLNL